MKGRYLKASTILILVLLMSPFAVTTGSIHPQATPPFQAFSSEVIFYTPMSNAEISATTTLYATNSNALEVKSFRRLTVLPEADVVKVGTTNIMTLQFNGRITATITSIDPNPVSRGNPVTINLNATNIGFIPCKSYASMVVYDELGIPVASEGAYITIGIGTHRYSLTMLIPTWAYVGVATAYLNLYTIIPTSSGVTYGPETTATFRIASP